MLETIKATTYVDSKVCTRHGRNLHEILKKKIRQKAKLQTVKLRKLR